VTSTPAFEPALQLNAAFYDEVVGPMLRDVPHAAGRLGWGSEVLGFDTARSTDHGWGPQLQLFVAAADIERVNARLDAALPDTFHGWPVRYGWDAVAVRHHVYVATLGDWLTSRLGVDARSALSTADWLTMPQQKLLEVTRGAVFHDDDGELTRVRASLDWYPDDVWRWLLACQWQRVSQEEAFVGRTAEVGDELGSQIVAARVARDLARLWFLLARQYAPYSKWFGSAFAQLPGSAALRDALSDAMAARDYATRESALVVAYELVARHHNEVGVTAPVDPTVRDFYGRPFMLIMAERFVAACLADSALKDLPLVGSVDQVADSTDLLSYPPRAQRLRPLYDA
jgi:hypothetical protein